VRSLRIGLFPNTRCLNVRKKKGEGKEGEPFVGKKVGKKKKKGKKKRSSKLLYRLLLAPRA